jgi:hypothetical protein
MPLDEVGKRIGDEKSSTNAFYMYRLCAGYVYGAAEVFFEKLGIMG